MKRMLNRLAILALLFLAWFGLFSLIGTGLQAGLMAFCVMISLVIVLVNTSDDDADGVSG